MCLLTRALRAFMENTGFRYLSVCAGEVHVLLLIADVSNSNIKILERRLPPRPSRLRDLPTTPHTPSTSTPYFEIRTALDLQMRFLITPPNKTCRLKFSILSSNL